MTISLIVATIALFLYGPLQDDTQLPATVIGLVGAIVTGSLGFAGMVYRTQLVERIRHEAEMRAERDRCAADTKALTQAYNETIREMDKKHQEETKVTVERQHQFEAKLLDLLVANTATQREVTKSVENFVSLRDIQEELRENKRSKTVR